MSSRGHNPRGSRPASLIPLIASTILLLGAAPAQGALQLKGWLEWLHRVEMRVTENGVVQEVAVNAGQHVKKGQAGVLWAN